MDFIRFVGAFSLIAVVVFRANAYATETAATIPADDTLLRSSDHARASSPPGGDQAKADAKDCE